MHLGFRSVFPLLPFALTIAALPAAAQLLTDATDPLQYVPLQTPCRAIDTRLTGGPIAGGASRNINPAGGVCNFPVPTSGTIAYALNVTVIPHGPLGFMTIWPAGELQPVVSTLNSPDGRVKANAAIVTGGSGGEVTVFASSTADVVVDVNGYFIPQTPVPPTYTYFPLAPCRLVDTRLANNTGFGAPSLTGGQGRTFALQFSSCNLPTDPLLYGGAFSLNVTAVPKGGKPLNVLTVWGTPQGWPLDQPAPPPPLASTLNAPTGAVTANAAIVTVNIMNDEAISVYASDDADVVIDVNGYFGYSQQVAGGLSLYTLPPCRVIDTRKVGGAFQNLLAISVSSSSCGVPDTAHAYVLNATVVPSQPLGFLTLWPNATTQPVASTLNANDGTVTSNMAVVETTNGSIDAFASSPTQLLLDISGYFAP